MIVYAPWSPDARMVGYFGIRGIQLPASIVPDGRWHRFASYGDELHYLAGADQRGPYIEVSRRYAANGYAVECGKCRRPYDAAVDEI